MLGLEKDLRLVDLVSKVAGVRHIETVKVLLAVKALSKYAGKDYNDLLKPKLVFDRPDVKSHDAVELEYTNFCRWIDATKNYSDFTHSIKTLEGIKKLQDLL